MMKKIFTLLLLFHLATISIAQTFFMGASMDGFGFTSPTTQTYGGSSYEKWYKTATSTGNQYLFHANAFSDKWQNNNTPLNSQYTLFFGNSASPDGVLNFTPTVGRTYTFKLRRNAYANSNAIVMETDNVPVTITSVTQSPASPTSAETAVVTINLSGSVSSQENVFLRYSTDNFATYGTLLVRVGGGTATIPAQSQGTVVRYYVFSTTLAQGSINGNSGLTDLSTINIDNNGGSNYSYTVQAPLPVSLTQFNAKTESSSINLNWQTVSETNNAFFEIERSADVKVWETLARIDGKGTTAELQNYTYLDQTPRKGINYYRLKQVDTDGTFAYSRVRDAVIERNPDANVYPNPVSDLLRISGISEAAEVNIMDLLGNTKFQKTIQRDVDIDLKGFSEGVYLVRITDETATKVRKIRVLR